MSAKNNPVLYLFAKVWEFSKGQRGKVIFYSTLFVFANLVSLCEPLLVAKILNMIQLKGLDFSNVGSILLYISLFFAITISFWLFHGPARVMERKNSFLVGAKYKQYLLDGTMDLSAQWHADHQSGDTIDKVEKGTHALESFTEDTNQVIEMVITFVVSYLALAYFNLHAAYLVLIMVLFLLIVVFKFDKVMAKQYKELNKMSNSISAKIYDVISNITTVMILRVEKVISVAVNKKIMSPFKLYSTNVTLSELKWFLVNVCTSIMIVLVLGSYVFFTARAGDVILIGTIYALYGYVERIAQLFFRFAYKYGAIVRYHNSVLNSEELSKDFCSKDLKSAISLKSGWKEIKIESLGFSYNDEKGEQHLENVNLVIRKGEKIALIGESGSGKTTFLKIIRDLYSPQKGKVYINNYLLPRGFKSISDDVSLIPQDPEIFATTIKENITLGVNHSANYLKKFTDLAQFTQVVQRLPKGLNSSIFERGVNLSGGEKQRLALARGLLASENKEIILLDEPTSSVDSKNELIIYADLFKKFQGKTIISSIHRLHLLYLFDVIYLFENGKIVDSGTFDELLKKSKNFRILWKKYNAAQEKSSE